MTYYENAIDNCDEYRFNYTMTSLKMPFENWRKNCEAVN